MPPEAQDQGQESQSNVTFDELFAKGWEEAEKEEAQEPAPPKKEAEPECPECPDKKKAALAPDTRKPYRVLKVDGKDVPVYSEDELAEWAQKGHDYTKKTQKLSDERREFDTDRKKLEKLSEDVIELLKRGEKPTGELQKDQKKEGMEPEGARIPTKEELYARFKVDEFTDEPTKNLIDAHVELMTEFRDHRIRSEESNKIAQALLVKEAVMKIGEFIAEARQEFPFEDVIDQETGKNLTAHEFMDKILPRFEAEKGRPIKEIVRDVTREYHLGQRGSKGKESADVKDDMSPEDFRKKFPGLAARLSETAKKTAVADHEDEMSKLPPSIETKRGESLKDEAGKNKAAFESLDESIDEFFKNPANTENLLGERT